MGYYIFTYPDTGRANAVCEALNKINDNFVFTTNGTIITGTINGGIPIKFTPPTWECFCFTSDSSGFEFISFTKYSANTTTSVSMSANMLVIANTGEALQLMPNGGDLYKYCNIPSLSFNRQTENIITPLICDGVIINNLYISPTGLSPVKGTIVSDGDNKYISLENAIYAKYVE